MGWVPEFSVRGRDSKGLARWSMKGNRQGCVAGGSLAVSFHRGDPRGTPLAQSGCFVCGALKIALLS